MHNFITSLFNIDKEKIKNIHIVSSKELTELHITLISEKLPCPYCRGITHIMVILDLNLLTILCLQIVNV